MPSPHECDIGRLKDAEARRQAILDYLRGNPGVNAAAVSQHMTGADDDKTISATLSNMVKWGEIAGSGGRHNRAYYAISITTRTAEDCRAARLAGQRESVKKKKEQAAKKPESTWRGLRANGRTVYKSGDNPEIAKHQRGQGANRPRVYVNCEQNY